MRDSAIKQHRFAARRGGGGHIPGLSSGADGDAVAFEFFAGQPSPIPVLIAVPHAGRSYRPGLLARMRHPESTALRLEDRLADRLGEAVAQAAGASLLIARAPRAMIDLNRAPSDVDWDMLGMASPAPPQPNARARSGLGLVPRRLPGMGEIWRGRLSRDELDERIDLVHRPYHAALAAELAAIRARWGAALLIDLHSMPSLPRNEGRAGAEIVLGDRFGATCRGDLVASAFAHFAACGRNAAHNRPYAGGYVLDSHANPRGGIHALQLEIDRATYLDSRGVDLGDGFAGMVCMLVGLVRRLAGEVAVLGVGPGQNWAEAAE
jgi:N-formylglutamate amidohydrolase